MTAEADSRRLLIAVAIVLLAAAAFWLLLLSPKRKEADELATQVASQQQVLTEAQTKEAEGEAARKAFPKDYREMVVLGKAVPEGDETASLIVQIATIASRSHVEFQDLTLESTGGESTETASLAQEAGPSSAPKPVPPTEAEAALLPLGATVGEANLGAMPYKLSLLGTYSHVADFIQGVERLIKTHDEHLTVNGRLLTMDGVSLTPEGDDRSSILSAEIGFTAYLAPPSAEPAEVAAGEVGAIEGEAPVTAPEAETTTASPSSYSTGEAR
jgi:Tfp pilus assembly protein PilO